MKIEKYSYEGDPNIGFYATVTSRYAVYPYNFQKKDVFEIENAVTRIAGTQLVGLFTAGNENCLLVPKSIKEIEEKKLEKAGIPYQIIESRQNALGNLIICNDKGALISEKLEENKKEIQEALQVPVKTGKIAGTTNPGVSGKANNNGVLLHRAATEKEAEKTKEALKVEKVDIGTINMGSPYISSGILCNDKSFLVGEDTTGPELGRIDQVLIPKNSDN